MLKYKLSKLLLIFLIIIQNSCTPENSSKTRILLDKNNNSENAAEADADIDFTPTKEDLKCSNNQECIIIEKGCCYHEKPMAVRQDRTFEILTGPAGIHAKCRDFNREKKKKNEKISCQGRESFADWTSGLVALCKKEEGKTEGECTLAKKETKPSELVEIWVKDPIANISKRLKYKYGETWGDLKTKAAELFGKKGTLIYSPNKNFPDSHAVKEEEMKYKYFIMFIPDK
jgi:hypothetical protein